MNYWYESNNMNIRSNFLIVFPDHNNEVSIEDFYISHKVYVHVRWNGVFAHVVEEYLKKIKNPHLKIIFKFT